MKPCNTLLAILLLAAAGPSIAADAEAWSVHGQATWIEQLKPSFGADYSGAHSLSPLRETSYSQTVTLFLAARLPGGLELYADPEVARGVPLSGLVGIAGYPNGEMQKSAGTTPQLYRARLYLRRAWLLSDDRAPLAPGAHQLGGETAARRVTLTIGNHAVNDLFGHVALGNDPRLGFLNWAHMTYAAFDFAGDLRGYTWGAVAEYADGPTSLRAGRYLEPIAANAQALDHALGRHYFDVVEGERRLGESTRLAVLGFRARAAMGSWAAALAQAAGAVPDVTRSRAERVKYGAASTLETALAAHRSAFVTVAWADGGSEEYAFAEVDRSTSAGVVADGEGWQRPGDAAGLAVSANGLSGHHRDYLAAGGLGGFLGDGRMRYGSEASAEAWYRVALGPVQLSADVARLVNPAYNRDRGPVTVLSVRAHVEF